MAKTKETIDLENALIADTRKKRIYGCEEITIGFQNNGHGNERVDFATMDAKGNVKCYELKVSIQDLKSGAKKSWYGHYNYLVVTSELNNLISDWNEFIPSYVGVVVGYRGHSESFLSVVKKSFYQELTPEDEIMIKESMIRSVYWKMEKCKDAQSLKKQSELKMKIRKAEQDRDNYYKRAIRAERIINDYEIYKAANDGVEDINLELMAREEKERFRGKNNSVILDEKIFR